MKDKKKCLALLVFLSLLLAQALSASAEVTINYVSSTLNTSPPAPAQGSKGGGTVIYISGTNFSPNSDDTQVFFGPYPCNLIAKGSTVSMLSCTTSPMLNPSSPTSLPVTIYSLGRLPVTCTSYVCLFTYSDSLTPFIYQVYPTTMVGNQMVKISGVHRISDVGDGRSTTSSLKYILIGDTSCSTLDIIQDFINPNSNNIIFCNTFLNQDAGEYNTTERVIHGDAMFSFRNFDTSFFTGINFNVRLTAYLVPNTIRTGGALGHLLTFSGTGFSSNPVNLTNFTCALGTVSCSVIANPQGFIQIQLPAYKAGYETTGMLPKDTAETAPQQNAFLGSYGFRSTRFNRTSTKTLDQLLLDMRLGNNSEPVVYDGYQTQLSFMHDGSINYNDYLRGYFFAAVDGVYNFETTVDDAIIVYLSKVQGSSNPVNMVQIMKVDSYLNYQQDPYNSIGITNIATVSLKKGYYYMEVVARGLASYNYYYVSVSMPAIDITKISTVPLTTNPPLYNPTWKIENVVITPTSVLPEIITVTVDTGGFPNGTTTYSLSYFSGSGTSYTRVNSPNIPMRATLAQFSSAIRSFGVFAWFSPSFTMTMLNANGSVATNVTAVKYIYNISYQLTRGSAYGNPSPSLPAVTIVTTQAHSAGIAGTYVFRVGGVPLRVYDTMFRTSSTTIQTTNSLGQLQAALRAVYNAPQLQVISRNTAQLPDQMNFNILYFGVLSPQQITIDTSAMTGGTDDKLSVNITTLRNFDATRPYFQAIPFEFLRMAARLPTFNIMYNGLPAICVDCFYQYQPTATFSVTAAQFKTSKLGLNISLASNIPNVSIANISVSDITITLYGQPCNLDSTSTTSILLCTFNTVDCGSGALPKIPAGNEPPRVHIRQYGYANSTISLNNDLRVTSASPITLGDNGGVTVTAVGTGFPQSNPSQLIITANNATISGSIVITSVTACQVQFSFPPQIIAAGAVITTTLTYSVKYNTYSSNLNDATNRYTLNPALDPSVTALSLISASPIVKQNIVITGTNFDINPTKMRVFLFFASNHTQKYELGILSVGSTTSMTCVLGGGRVGDYFIRVLVVGKGMSAPTPASAFSYEIVVNSVSPVTGSIGGGFLLTINGANFAPAKGSTQVFIGDGLQSLCTIVTISTTVITCTVPPMDSTYLAGDIKTVLVTGRLIELSRCKGTCGFSYTTVGTINVAFSSSKTDFKAGETVTITTTNNFLTTPVVTVGTITVTLLTVQVSQITFAYPSLPAGQYAITVVISGVNAFPILQSTTSLSIGAISSTSGSNLGQVVSVIGNGFGSISNPSNVIYYVCASVPLYIPIQTITPTNVTFEIPTNPASTCTINVTMGLTFSLYTYSQSAARTPFIVVTDLGSFSYKVVVSNHNSKAIKFIVARYLNSNGFLTTTIFSMSWTLTTTNTYTVIPVGGYLPAGTFLLSVHIDTLGYADSTTNQFTISATAINALTPASVTASFGGQGSFTLSAAGFLTNNIQNNQITICGIRATILSATQTGITFQIPAFVNAQTRTQYGLGVVDILTSKGNPISDTTVKTNFAFDNNTKTIYSSINLTCFTGLDFGAGSRAMLTQIRYMPNPAWIRLDNLFDGAVFEGSNDNLVWTVIFTIDSGLIRTGWNTWLDATATKIYRYVRFRQTNGLSGCQLAQIEIYGIIYSTQTYSSSLPCPVSVNFYGVSKAYSNIITYSSTATSVITTISPAFGPSYGNTLVTITGTGFSTVSISVVIDGIVCTIVTATTTTITCITGPRLTPPAAGNSFVVTSGGFIAIVTCAPFLYMDRWSDSATWGGEVPPREGDTVYIPPGMTLLVDQSTPFLNTIMVEGGKIFFSDEVDITVDAKYFILIGGEFRAGTPSKPYNRKLTITLYGGYYDKQLPYFGNKVLGCMNCKFNMHGAIRTPTWTEITSTINPGDTRLNLLVPVDWVVGEKIAVAATGYNHFESEEKTIVAVSSDKKTLTVDTPFIYRHFSGTESYGGKQFVMNAEVGLLTRNIVIQGDNMTDIHTHGSHLIFMGKAASGLDATLSYTEIRRCGQPMIVARYCSHFHLAGQVPNSFVRGIAVHHSHARVLTIHGTHYLTVEKNVGFLVKGHNIFVEDGIQTMNIIQDNLMISTIASQTMLQSDTSPAGYWITNPLNTVINNRAAGGDFYGFWYEIKPNPDGPSATPNICPIGMRLGQSSNNWAHSQRKFGLRIFNYAARQYPCLPLTNQSLTNPFDFNPAFESVFDNYLLWKNQQNGVLGEQLGFVTLSNFLIIDSGQSGMEFYQANLTLQNVTAKKSVIVGFSSGNSPSDLNTLRNVRGIITPRTDGFRADDITFANFAPGMTPLKSCSKCQNLLFQVTGGKTSFFNNIKYSNIQGNYIFWNNWRREIFIDEDGTLTRPITTALGLPNGKFGGITPYFDHLNIPNFCYNIVNLWDNSSYCNENITLRALLYTNADPYDDFVGQTIRTFRMNALSDPDKPITYHIQPQIVIKKSHDIKGSWAFPYAVGYNYHTHFQFGIDFLHLSLAPSQYWLNNEGIVLKFNYTDQRELYKIGKYYGRKLQTPLITGIALNNLNATTCQNGDFHHNSTTRHLYVCVSGRNKALREWIDITGVRCNNSCPKSDPYTPRENFIRKWSNVTQWPNQTLPKAGANVTIPYEWNIILDLSPPAFNYVLVNGLLYFDYQDLNFQANIIWVQQGGIFIGSPDKPYTYKATIILNGNFDDKFLVLDPGASGNKMLAVTGALEFYGSPPNVTWTRLAYTAEVGSSKITVQDYTDWQVGNEIVIGATYSGQGEDQVFKIVSINGQIINLNGTLTYQHFGSATPITNVNGGVIDTRAAVGLLTRNIKITRGPDANNWGCRVQVYSYLMQFTSTTPPIPVNGRIYFDGVELDGCGQYGSSNAGLRIEKIGSIVNTDYATVVTRSTIRNCNGYCVYINRASNVTFNNNVIHFGRRYLVYVLKVLHYAFINNVMLGLRMRPEVVAQGAGTGIEPNNAAYSQFMPVNSDTDNVTVTNNLIQGSQDNGFVFPFTSCAKINTYPFAGNTAGSCFAAFITNVNPGFLCLAASGFTGYANYIGFIANPPGFLTQVQYTNMFFTDNQRAFTLRFAHEIDDNTMMLNDSYFMGYSRPSCPSCYSSTKLSYCNDGYAIRMFTATLSGQYFPFNKNITGFDVICTQESFDAKAFLKNVTFENYKFGANPQVPYCTSMNVFRKHDGASDATASHHLYDTSCINCDFPSLVYFSPSSPAWRGWAGGCGELDCTGSINYFIHDHTGHYTTTFNNYLLQPTQLLANNQPIGGNQTACQRVNQWNGYWCKFQELAVLEYQSIAADYNRRMVWPVYLSYDGGLWNSTTNGWKEWEWIAPGDPANRRLARFWSVLRLSRVYNMTYSSQPPSDAVYQIQKRQLPTGNPNDWVIIKIYFPVPNVVIVRVKNTTKANILVPGFQQLNGAYPDLKLSTGVCGANYYDFQNNVINFVVNGKSNCQVRLTLSSYVQLTVRFLIQISTFFTNNGPTTMLTNIVAFLNIDPSQIKIVSINAGPSGLTARAGAIEDGHENMTFKASSSTTETVITIVPSASLSTNTVQTNLTDPTSGLNVSNDKNPAQEANELTQKSNQLTTGLTNGAIVGLPPVLNVDTSLNTITTGGSSATFCPPSYLYNVTTKKCYCDVGYIENNLNCTSCSKVGNSTGAVNPNITNRCICKNGFVWSNNTLACVCPGAQDIVDAGGSCFSCIGLKNGTGVTATLTTCGCLPSFGYDKKARACICPDPQSYLFNNTCIGCTGFNNGTGKVLKGSLSCECLQTFFYDNATKTCICAANSVLLPNNTCLRCGPGLIFKVDKLACLCPIDNSAYVNGTCIPCTAANMTTAVVPAGNQCVCLNTYFWKNNACLCSDDKSVIINGSCIGCSGTRFNLSGAGVVNGSCSCKAGFTWLANVGICVCGVNSVFFNGNCYNCASYNNTVASTNSALTSCSCVNNLSFNTSRLICDCNNNSIIVQSTCVDCTSTTIRGVARVSINSCSCATNNSFIWNQATQTCICNSGFIINGSACVKCSTIPFSTTTSSLGVSCVCQATFIWSQNSLACVCDSNSVLGPVVSGTQKCVTCNADVGASRIDSTNSSRCLCLGSLIWDPTKKLCVCYFINPPTITNGTNSTNGTNRTNSTNGTNSTNATVVVQNYAIIAPDATCVPCNNLTDVNIVNPPVDSFNCKCVNPFFWDNIQMKCVNCSSLANAVGKTNNQELSCACKSGYYFDIYTNRCLRYWERTKLRNP